VVRIGFSIQYYVSEEEWIEILIYSPIVLLSLQHATVLGEESWFVTRFTADAALGGDPTLVSWLGLQGEANRRKLAETFLRPTTWGDYCALNSTNHCATPDAVAQRAPADDERDHMFKEGLYTGHFRATPENDCDTFPTNCTGHIADYPCGWSSFVEAQAYHLDIALKKGESSPGSHGYTYSQLIELWRAANATKSNLMFYWWTPEVCTIVFLR